MDCLNCWTHQRIFSLERNLDTNPVPSDHQSRATQAAGRIGRNVKYSCRCAFKALQREAMNKLATVTKLPAEIRTGSLSNGKQTWSEAMTSRCQLLRHVISQHPSWKCFEHTCLVLLQCIVNADVWQVFCFVLFCAILTNASKKSVTLRHLKSVPMPSLHMQSLITTVVDHDASQMAPSCLLNLFSVPLVVSQTYKETPNL